MKKAFTVLVFVILSITVLSAAFVPRVSFYEEIAYQKYNRIWTSPNSYYYSVQLLENDKDSNIQGLNEISSKDLSNDDSYTKVNNSITSPISCYGKEF